MNEKRAQGKRMATSLDFNESALAQELKALVEVVSRIDVDGFAGEYRLEMAHRDALVSKVLRRYVSKEDVAITETVIARRALKVIQDTPLIVKILVSNLTSDKNPIALRCATAGVLAYFIRRVDILPDNLPGGYGFTDDGLILMVGLMQYRSSANGLSSLDSREVWGKGGILWSCLPADQIGLCKAKMRGVKAIFNVLQALPSAVLRENLRHICEDPHRAQLPEAKHLDLEEDLFGETDMLKVTPLPGVQSANYALQFPGGYSLLLGEEQEPRWALR